MAEPVTGKHAAPPTRYPWSTWADGQLRRATPDVDFKSTPAAFCESGRRWAERNECTWSSVTEPTGCVVFTMSTKVQ